MRFRTCLPIPVLLVLCNCVSIYASNEVKCIENTNQCNTNDVLDSNNVQTEVLSRRRRYVAFPEGSSLSMAFCGVLGFIGTPSISYFSYAWNWGVIYDLPNDTWILANRNKPFPKPLTQRRHRRDLYKNMEVAIDNMGYDGRDCILRALCESAQYFYKKSTNMVEELIRTVFSLPDTKVLSTEHNDIQIYDTAYRLGKTNVLCSLAFRQCDLSLIELALGEYSKPNNFM